MATSKCPKCENASFEVTNNSPLKSNFKLLFVQCSRCGTVIGTMDFWNVGTLLKEMEKNTDKIPQMERQLSVIQSNLAGIIDYLNRKK